MLYVRITVKTFNLGPHRKFGPSLAISVGTWMNRTEFATLQFFYNLNFLHFSVGYVLAISSSSEKESPKFTWRPELEALTVLIYCYFHGWLIVRLWDVVYKSRFVLRIRSCLNVRCTIFRCLRWSQRHRAAHLFCWWRWWCSFVRATGVRSSAHLFPKLPSVKTRLKLSEFGLWMCAAPLSWT